MSIDARTTASEILSRHFLPEDMRGFGFLVPVFGGSVETLQRFYPDRSPALQQAINEAIRLEIERRGGRVQYVTCSAIATQAWSSPEAMRAEADRHYARLNPPGTLVTAEGCIIPPGYAVKFIPHPGAT